MIWASEATFVVAAYDEGGPLPDNIVEAWLVSPGPEVEVDCEEIEEAIQSTLRGHSYSLDDTWSVFSWGASGAGIAILVGVGSGTAVLLIDRLLKVFSTKVRKQEPDVSREARDGEQATELAKFFLARARRVPLDSISVDRLDQRVDDFEVRLSVPNGDRFVVEVDPTGDVHHLRRE